MTVERVAQVLLEVKGYRDLAIDRSTRLLDDLHFDSMEVMTFILQCEQTFDINFSDADLDLDNFRTVGHVVDLLERHRAAQGSPRA